MLKVPKMFSRANKIAQESDFGRRFGWFIEKDGEKIGELDYLRWDCDSQFWHEYQLNWFNSKYSSFDPNDWISSNLALRNRRYQDVYIKTFLTSGIRKGVIAVRGAYVSEARFLLEDKI